MPNVLDIIEVVILVVVVCGSLTLFSRYMDRRELRTQRKFVQEAREGGLDDAAILRIMSGEKRK